MATRLMFTKLAACQGRYISSLSSSAITRPPKPCLCCSHVPQGVVVIQVKSLNPPPAHSRQLPAQLDVFEIERSFSSGQGAVVGITDFVLRRMRSFQADATSECVVYEISRSALEVMVKKVPAVATALQVSCASLVSTRVTLCKACADGVSQYGSVPERICLSSP